MYTETITTLYKLVMDVEEKFTPYQLYKNSFVLKTTTRATTV